MKQKLVKKAALLTITLILSMISLGQPLIGGTSLGQTQPQADPAGELKDQGPSSARHISGDEVDSLIVTMANERPMVAKHRVFEQGRITDYPADAAVLRQTGAFFPEARSIVAKGIYGGAAVIEEIRFVESDGVVYALHDLYVDGSPEDLSAGRSTPFPITEGAHTGTVTLQTVQASPQVSSIGGVSNYSAGISNGRVSMSCGSVWNGNLVINDQPGVYPWTINGANFGSARGRVQFDGRDVAVSTWSTSRITADPTVPYYYAPICTLIKITTAGGQSTLYGVNVVPAIRSRIYGQCTWFVAQTRINLGGQPSPSAYGSYSSISGNWIPQVRAQLAWSGRHTAIITAVSGPVYSAGGYKKYTLTIEEFNNQCNNRHNRYTTDFETRTVNGITTVTKFPQSSVSSFGSAIVYYPR